MGDTLYKVHRSMLADDSTFFSDLFDLPMDAGVTREGTEENPIIVCLSTS